MTGYQLPVGHVGETKSSHHIVNWRPTWKRVACPGMFRDDALIVRCVDCIRTDDPRVMWGFYRLPVNLDFWEAACHRQHREKRATEVTTGCGIRKRG